jgi:hypothetical protein
MLRPNMKPHSNAQDDELSEMLRVQFDIREMNAFFSDFAEEMVPDYLGAKVSAQPQTTEPKQIDLWEDFRAA